MFQPEQPLSFAEWSEIHHSSANVARRRYRYQAHLLAKGLAQFAPSLLAFQQLTGRDTDSLVPPAIATLRKALAVGSADVALLLWQSLTSHAFPASDDVTDLSSLCAVIADTAHFLSAQEKQLLPSPQSNTPEWQGVVLALAIVMDELSHSPISIPLVRDGIAHLLAPFPDFPGWQGFTYTQASAQWNVLQLYRARVGVSHAFAAYESVLLYRVARA